MKKDKDNYINTLQGIFCSLLTPAELARQVIKLSLDINRYILSKAKELRKRSEVRTAKNGSSQGRKPDDERHRLRWVRIAGGNPQGNLPMATGLPIVKFRGCGT